MILINKHHASSDGPTPTSETSVYKKNKRCQQKSDAKILKLNLLNCKPHDSQSIFVVTRCYQ